MLTRCDHCETQFKINDQLVNENDATVRCGECGVLFDARQHLIDEFAGTPYELPDEIKATEYSPSARSSVATDSTTEHHEFQDDWKDYDQTTDYTGDYSSDYELDYTRDSSAEYPDDYASDDHYNPAARKTDWSVTQAEEYGQTLVIDQLTGLEPPYEHSPAPSAVRGSSSRKISVEQPVYAANNAEIVLRDVPGVANDIFDKARTSIVNGTANTADRSLLANNIVVPVNQQSTPQKSKRWPLLLGLVAVALALGFALRDPLSRLPMPYAVQAAFCQMTGCELSARRSLAQLELLQRKVYSHPTVDGALVISIDLVNRAEFTQSYPTLSVTMTNEQGQAVAQREFMPNEYLAAEFFGAQLEPNRPVRINLEIIDPGVEAKSYELNFL